VTNLQPRVTYRMFPVISCSSGRCKGCHLLVGVFLQLVVGSYWPPNLPKFSPMGNACLYTQHYYIVHTHSATIRSSRSRLNTTQNASFCKRMCLLGAWKMFLWSLGSQTPKMVDHPWRSLKYVRQEIQTLITLTLLCQSRQNFHTE